MIGKIDDSTWKSTLAPFGQMKAFVGLSLFRKPSDDDINFVMMRAEQALEVKMISKLPNLSASHDDGNWKLIIECEKEDRPFWFGFYLGRDFCVNNRFLTVGVE